MSRAMPWPHCWKGGRGTHKSADPHRLWVSMSATQANALVIIMRMATGAAITAPVTDASMVTEAPPGGRFNGECRKALTSALVALNRLRLHSSN
jgi:hypothetical protein